MAKNFRTLQEKMDPAVRAANEKRARAELQKMALDELRSAKHLTQTYLAEMLDTPQSSISRIEQRADMYLSTLRGYVNAMGGVLQIQAVFPDGTVTINRFGDYEDRSFVVRASATGEGRYRLKADPLDDGEPLSTKPLKMGAFTKTLKALHIPEQQIAEVQQGIGDSHAIEIGGNFGRRVFSEPDLISAGFEHCES